MTGFTNPGAVEQAANGGAQPSPTTLTLGPYTIANVDGHEASVDLGANALGFVRAFTTTVTAINYDGGDPANGLGIDPETSPDNGTFTGSSLSLPLPAPPLYTTQALPATLDPVNGVLRRYLRIAYAWGGDQGANASATFFVTVEYF